MAGVRKNGKAYDSGDVVITLLGTVESEVKMISYTTDQEHQLNHSLSNTATSWSMGKIQPEASIELYMNAVSKLEKLAGGNLMAIAPFDINVSYINDFNDLVNDTLTVKFTNMGRKVDGSMGLSQEFKLLALDIKYNNA